jgi:hypothetical protein
MVITEIHIQQRSVTVYLLVADFLVFIMRSQNLLLFVMSMSLSVCTSGISFHIIEAYETNV